MKPFYVSMLIHNLNVRTRDTCSSLVPKLRVNYPNSVIVPFDLGNDLFFSNAVLTTTYFIEHKESTLYTVCSNA